MSAPRRHVISREAMLDGGFDRLFEQQQLPDRLSPAEIEASLSESMALAPRGDVWVFAYGSLLWNPVIHFTERRMARLNGFHRRFCLWSSLGRGTPEQPGLMLGLERGGSCVGAALRVPRAKAREELMLLWRREMITGAYAPRWLPLEIDGVRGRRSAMVFTMNRKHARYAGKLPETKVAQAVGKAAGPLGSCLDYFDQTCAALAELQVVDGMFERLKRKLPGRK